MVVLTYGELTVVVLFVMAFAYILEMCVTGVALQIKRMRTNKQARRTERS